MATRRDRPHGSTYSVDRLLREAMALLGGVRGLPRIAQQLGTAAQDRLERRVAALQKVSRTLLLARERARRLAAEKERAVCDAHAWITLWRYNYSTKKRIRRTLPARPPRNSRNPEQVARHIDVLCALSAPDMAWITDHIAPMATSLRAVGAQHQFERRGRVPRLIAAERRAKIDVWEAMARLVALTHAAEARGITQGHKFDLKGLRRK